MSSSESKMLLLRLEPHLLEKIVSKLSPSTLSLMREASHTVNVIATKEAIRRDIVAIGTEMIFYDCEAVLFEGQMNILKASSLIYRSESEVAATEEAEKFWKERTVDLEGVLSIPAIHYGGMIIDTVRMEMQDTTAKMMEVLDANNFGINKLSALNCYEEVVEEILEIYKPKELIIKESILPQYYPMNEMYDLASRHLTSKTLKKISISPGEEEFPVDFAYQFIMNAQNGIEGVQSIEIICDYDAFLGKFGTVLGEMDVTPIAVHPMNFVLLYSHEEEGIRRHFAATGEPENGLLNAKFIRISTAEELKGLADDLTIEEAERILRGDS